MKHTEPYFWENHQTVLHVQYMYPTKFLQQAMCTPFPNELCVTHFSYFLYQPCFDPWIVVSLSCRVQSTQSRIPIRLFLTNESGYILDMSMYKEVDDERTGQIMFQAYGTKQVQKIFHYVYGI